MCLCIVWLPVLCEGARAHGLYVVYIALGAYLELDLVTHIGCCQIPPVSLRVP